MFPVLFSIGSISISSFGVSLVLGFILSLFLIWRLSRAWDLSEEKTLDLILLTFIGGLIGARLYFAIENLSYFANSPLNLILINKAPGFNFWGGFLGGWLVLYFFARRFKINFWQIADIALIGLLGGLILSQLGCFLSACSIGIPSKSFFAITQVGFIGKRWPVQLLEAFLLTLSLIRLWSVATRFHLRGKIASLGFIYIGIINLALEPLKQNHSGILFEAIITILGFTIYYLITKQSPIAQAKFAWAFSGKLLSNNEFRKRVVQKSSRYWYNQIINIIWKVRNLKKLLRRSNVKFS